MSTPPCTSYSLALKTTNYAEQFMEQMSAYERREHYTLTTPYEANKERSLTLWAPPNTSPFDVIDSIRSQYNDPVDTLVLGVQKDTRVISTVKINIVATTDSAAQYLATTGIKIGQQRLYPRPPPPAQRGYLPYFPVGSHQGRSGTSCKRKRN